MTNEMSNGERLVYAKAIQGCEVEELERKASFMENEAQLHEDQVRRSQRSANYYRERLRIVRDELTRRKKADR